MGESTGRRIPAELFLSRPRPIVAPREDRAPTNVCDGAWVGDQRGHRFADPGGVVPPASLSAGSLPERHDLYVVARILDRGLVALENSPEGHERVILTPKGYEAYRRLVQWINEVVRGLPPRG